MANKAFVGYGGGPYGPITIGGTSPDTGMVPGLEVYVSYAVIAPDGVVTPRDMLQVYPSYLDDADDIRVKAAAAVRNSLGDPEAEIVFIDLPGSRKF